MQLVPDGAGRVAEHDHVVVVVGRVPRRGLDAHVRGDPAEDDRLDAHAAQGQVQPGRDEAAVPVLDDLQLAVGRADGRVVVRPPGPGHDQARPVLGVERLPGFGELVPGDCTIRRKMTGIRGLRAAWMMSSSFSTALSMADMSPPPRASPPSRWQKSFCTSTTTSAVWPGPTMSPSSRRTRRGGPAGATPLSDVGLAGPALRRLAAEPLVHGVLPQPVLALAGDVDAPRPQQEQHSDTEQDEHAQHRQRAVGRIGEPLEAVVQRRQEHALAPGSGR